MTGSINEAGKVLGTTSTVAGSSAVLAHSGFKILSVVLIVVAILGGLLIVFSSTVKRLLVRK